MFSTIGLGVICFTSVSVSFVSNNTVVVILPTTAIPMPILPNEDFTI